MKKATAFLTAFFLFVTVFSIDIASVLASNNMERREDIVILYTNDVHCGVNDAIGYDGLALYKKEMESLHDNVLLVDAGDTIQGDVIGSVSRGEDIITLMNELDYDVATIGNHEFDYGIDRLKELSKKLDCGYVCCNYFDEYESLVYERYRMYKAGDKRIAFVGAVTPRTFTTSTPAFFKNSKGEYIYSFAQNDKELYDVIQQNADLARKNGADIVVLLGHLGEVGIGYKKWTAQEVVKHTDNIDVVIDGHSHSVTENLIEKNAEGKDVIITQTGTKLKNIGKMTISEDNKIKTELISEVPAPSKDMKISEDEWLSINERGGRNVDKDMYEKINAAKKKISDKLSTFVGSTDFDLTVSNPETGEIVIRNSETNSGDFFTDCLREISGADIGLLNSDAIRSSIPSGDITVENIFKVFSYINYPSTAKVTGQQILDYLEFGAKSYPGEDGSFAQVSGLSYEIAPDIMSSVVLDEYGEFVGVNGDRRVRNVRLSDGSAIDPEGVYKLASNEYILKNGGDAGIFSANCEELSVAKENVYVSFANYIRNKLGGVIPEKYRNPYGQGRITIYSESLIPPKTDISEWTVNGIEDKTYTGEEITQEISVENEDEKADVEISYSNNKMVGTAEVIITGTGDYNGQIIKTFKIKKAENPLNVTAKSKTVSMNVLKKGNLTLKKAFTVKNAKGSVKYKKLGGSKKLTIDENGTITVKKGSYRKNTLLKIKVRISAKGTKNFKSGYKTEIAKIIVR